MAFPQSRSMNAELNEGSTDGKYKKVINDRGGSIDAATYKSRLDLNNGYYAVYEEQVKVTPDGRVVHTPNYVHTPDATYAGVLV